MAVNVFEKFFRRMPWERFHCFMRSFGKIADFAIALILHSQLKRQNPNIFLKRKHIVQEKNANYK